MKKLIPLLIFIFMLFAQSVYANETQDSKQFSIAVNKTLTTRKYVLGPNDVISIKFYNVPKLDQENLKVQPDGNILLSAFGALNVAGMTIEELRGLLIEKYSYYLKNPDISISLNQSKPFIVYVTGAVENPGGYELDTNTSAYQYVNSIKPEIQIQRKTPILSNILVAAGGICYDADLEHVKVINKYDGSAFEIDLLDLISNGNSAQDIYLTAGDTVYVPRLPTPLGINPVKYKQYASATFSPHSVPVKVIGYVNSPGLIDLDPAHSLNINSAISKAGGYLTDSAYAPKKVYLSRVDSSGKFVTTEINPMSKDVVLMPNDIVYVPEKTRPLVGKSFDYMARLIAPVGMFASSYNNWSMMFDPTRFAN
ncbi:MAG: polysaccharide export protein [Candidatus Gastranaerophilales bacterium]|nr:polysaccharide export protein [Candidatus Gastranaerophilales bacterium]